MQILSLSTSFSSRGGRPALTRRDAVEPLTARDLPEHAVAPATASEAIPTRHPSSLSTEPAAEYQPLPPSRALAVPVVVAGRSESLAAHRAYAAPRRAAPFPAGSLLRLAV